MADRLRFSISQEVLSDAVMLVSRALPQKATLPVLEGIHMVCSGEGLLLQAGDLSLGMSHLITEGVVSQDAGQVLVAGRLFADLVHRMAPGDVTVIQEETRLTINAGEGVFTLPLMEADKYPSLDVNIQMERPFEIPCAVLAAAIGKTRFALAQEESRPILTGELLERADTLFSCVALDGHRMAVCDVPMDQEAGQDAFRLVIPGRALTEVQHMLAREGNCQIFYSASNALIQIGGTTLVTRLLAGEYSQYRKLIPQNFSLRVELLVSALREAVERAALLAREAVSNVVKLSVQDTCVILTASGQQGDARDAVPAAVEGDLIDICFNAKLLLDMLKQVQSPAVVLRMSTANAPCKLESSQPDDWQYVLMPVRVAE